MPARVGPLIKISMRFRHTIDWPLRPIIQPFRASENSVKRGSRSGGMQKPCPTYLDLFMFSASSKDWTLHPNTLHLNSELLRKSPHHIPSIYTTTLFKRRKSSHIISTVVFKDRCLIKSWFQHVWRMKHVDPYPPAFVVGGVLWAPRTFSLIQTTYELNTQSPITSWLLGSHAALSSPHFGLSLPISVAS